MIRDAPVRKGVPYIFDPEGPRPYWAFAWAGGQGLARFILDNPAMVRGCRVVDFGAGSGICAVAAARSGAAHVVATDIDPVAVKAIEMNARYNEVSVEPLMADLKDKEPCEWDILFAADAFYNGQDHAWLLRHAACKRSVIIGDPSCRGFPKHLCTELARYRIRTYPDLEDWTADVQILRVASDVSTEAC